MKLRFQIGSSIELANRNTSRFSTDSLPRKWSMRKTRSSGKARCRHSLSSRADCEVAAERLLDDDPGVRR